LDYSYIRRFVADLWIRSKYMIVYGKTDLIYIYKILINQHIKK